MADTVGIINEQGDLGLGFDELSDDEREKVEKE